MVTQIIAGTIIDTFATLREDEKAKKEDMLNVCFICGYDRESYEKKHGGFDSHRNEDHNIWNYIFYISYIKNKEKVELTSIESYVKSCVDNNNIEWFPT